MHFRDVGQALTEVGSKYHFHKAPAQALWLQQELGRILRWIAEFLRDLFRPHGEKLDSHGMSLVIQILVYAAGVVGIILLVVLVLRRIGSTRAKTAVETAGSVEMEEILDASGWRKQATKLAAGSEYKGACRALYLSLLQRLDEEGIAQFEPARTNYEYSYLLAKHPSLQRNFKDVADNVEYIWFGNKKATEQDYDQSMHAVEGIEGQLREINQAKKPAVPQ